MIHPRFTQVSGAVLLALTLAFAGCSRKTENTSSKDTGTTPAEQQAEEGRPDPSQPGPGASSDPDSQPVRRSSEKSKQGWGDQGKSQGSGPAYATDRFSKQPQATRAQNYTLDAGSRIVVRTINSLSTKTARAGEQFEASLEQPLVVGDHTIVPKGTSAFGQVTVSDPSGRLKGSSYLGVQLTAIALPNGDRIAIQTATNERISKGTGKKTGVKMGIGAGLGALIGALAGGGKGAAIGAGAGGAAGAGVAYATGGNPAVIPSESVLTFQLAAPVTIKSRD